MLCCCAAGSEDAAEVAVVERRMALPLPCLRMPEPAEFLTFTIIGARGFRNPEWMPGDFSDCYVVVKSTDQEIAQTDIVSDSMEPVWRKEFEHKEWNEGAELEFYLCEKDLFGCKYLGKTTIQYDRFQDGFNGDLQLEETGGDGKEHHHVYLRVKIKPPGTWYPPGPPVEFEVTLEKGENKDFGLDVDIQDKKTLYIAGLADGPAGDYNQQAAPELQVVMGDFILEANGVSGDASGLLHKLRDDDAVVVKIRRGIDVTLILDRKKVTNKNGTEGDLQPLGIEWPDRLKGRGLVITAINEGLFADWNDSQTEDSVAKIQVGDRIMRVGSTIGSAKNISKAIQEVSSKFQLSLARTAPELFDDEGQKMDGSSHWRFSH